MKREDTILDYDVCRACLRGHIERMKSLPKSERNPWSSIAVGARIENAEMVLHELDWLERREEPVIRCPSEEFSIDDRLCGFKLEHLMALQRI